MEPMPIVVGERLTAQGRRLARVADAEQGQITLERRSQRIVRGEVRGLIGRARTVANCEHQGPYDLRWVHSWPMQGASGCSLFMHGDNKKRPPRWGRRWRIHAAAFSSVAVSVLDGCRLGRRFNPSNAWYRSLLHIRCRSHDQFRNTQTDEIFGGHTQRLRSLGEELEALLGNIKPNRGHCFSLKPMLPLKTCWAVLNPYSSYRTTGQPDIPSSRIF